MTMVTRNSEAMKQQGTSSALKDATKGAVHLGEAVAGVSDTAFGGMATGHLGDDGLSEPLGHSTNVPILPAGTVQRRDSVMSNGSSFTHTGLNDEDNEDSDDEASREKRSGRRKIRIEYIEDKSRRHITFSKRKAGIMKKAYELSTLTGTQVLLLVASETGHVYTFATPKLQPLITKPEGKNLIQACLNAPDMCSPEFGTQGMGYDTSDDPGKEHAYDDPSTQGQSSSSISANYAAAMAGLAGLYPAGQGTQAAAFLNPAHYPAAYAAAQYNAALAAGYWPGTTGSMGTSQHQSLQPSSQNSAEVAVKLDPALLEQQQGQANQQP